MLHLIFLVDTDYVLCEVNTEDLTYTYCREILSSSVKGRFTVLHRVFSIFTTTFRDWQELLQ